MLPNSLRPKRRAPWAESLKTKLCIVNQRALVPGREFVCNGLGVQSLHRLARHGRSSLNLAVDWILEVKTCNRQGYALRYRRGYECEMAHPACNCSVSNLCWGASSAIVEAEWRAGWRRGRSDSQVCPSIGRVCSPGVSKNHVVQSKRLTITTLNVIMYTSLASK